MVDELEPCPSCGALPCERCNKLEAEVARLREALEGVLPYTEAERLAEESRVRTGLNRTPIRYAVNRARAALKEANDEAG